MSKLHRRGAIYYEIIAIPTDLQGVLGKKQKWVSLRTPDRKQALRRQPAVKDEWTAIFDDMRRRRHLTDEDISTAVWEHYSTKIEEGDRERATRPTAAQIDAAEEKALLDANRAGVTGLIASILPTVIFPDRHAPSPSFRST
jgi:hypothetical protein